MRTAPAVLLFALSVSLCAAQTADSLAWEPAVLLTPVEAAEAEACWTEAPALRAAVRASVRESEASVLRAEALEAQAVLAVEAGAALRAACRAERDAAADLSAVLRADRDRWRTEAGRSGRSRALWRVLGVSSTSAAVALGAVLLLTR